MDIITTCFLLLADHPIITSTSQTPSIHISTLFASIPHTHISSIPSLITSLITSQMIQDDAICCAVTRIARWQSIDGVWQWCNACCDGIVAAGKLICLCHVYVYVYVSTYSCI